MEGMIGEIRGFAGTFAPRSWSLCYGQLLAISANSAMYAILGTLYGGDGRSSFGIPDMRGRVPIGEGTGPGLTTRVQGFGAGAETHLLQISEMPVHTHTALFTPTGGGGGSALTATVTVNAASAPDANPAGENPTGRYWAQSAASGADQGRVYGSVADTQMAADAVTVDITGSAGGITGGTVTNLNTGASVAHNIMQPYTTIQWIIAYTGIFPSRN